MATTKEKLYGSLGHGLTEEDIKPYRKHPRVIELRLVNLYETTIMNWGASKGTEIFRFFADAFNCEWSKIQAILAQKHLIKRSVVGYKRRLKQEIVFAASLYGEPQWYIATHYLKVSPDYYYRRGNVYRFATFTTPEWLKELDVNVQVCGIEGLKLEAIRFLEGFEQFMGVYGNVSISKNELRGYGAVVEQ